MGQKVKKGSSPNVTGRAPPLRLLPKLAPVSSAAHSLVALLWRSATSEAVVPHRRCHRLAQKALHAFSLRDGEGRSVLIDDQIHIARGDGSMDNEGRRQRGLAILLGREEG